MDFPKTGMEHGEIMSDLSKRKDRDLDWRNGRVFGLIYHANEEVEKIKNESHELYSSENALSPAASPSVLELENEVVAMTSDLFNGDEEVVGNVTTGGTESNMLAIKAARDWARENHPEIESPEIVFPETTHPSVAKAAHNFSLEPVRTPVGDDWRADLDALRDAISDNTIIVVASAPSFPTGVIDPIEDIGEIALENDILCHIDSCIGGFVLPFIRDHGYEIPPFDFSVPGVTSLSADQHKFGYTHKGASTILYKNEELRKHQFFVYNDWPSGMYSSPNFTGSKSGGPIASAWAVMNYLGEEGYKELTGIKMEAVEKIREEIGNLNGLQIIADPDAHLVTFGTVDEEINSFAVYDILTEKGWLVSPLKGWDIHLTITVTEAKVIDEFIDDLEYAVQEARGDDRAPDETVGAGYGVLEDDENAVQIGVDSLNELYKL